MAKKFRMYRRPRKVFSARVFVRLMCVVAVVFVLFESFQSQFGELFAPLAPKARPPSIVSLGASAPAGPTIIKPGAGPSGVSGGPKVVELGANVIAPAAAPETPAAAKLPTIVKLGSAPDSTPTASIPRSRFEIVDSDTFRADGQSYQLVGVDAPESGEKAKCAAERELAARTTRQLREIVAGNDIRLDRRACACPAGTEGTEICNSGRLCGALTANGRDVAAILIGEGLAKRYQCGMERCPPKQPWC